MTFVGIRAPDPGTRATAATYMGDWRGHTVAVDSMLSDEPTPRHGGSPGAPVCRLIGHRAWASGPLWWIGGTSQGSDPRRAGPRLSIGVVSLAGVLEGQAKPAGVGHEIAAQAARAMGAGAGLRGRAAGREAGGVAPEGGFGAGTRVSLTSSLSDSTTKTVGAWLLCPVRRLGCQV